MMLLNGSKSSRRFTWAIWPTLSKEVGTSHPSGSSLCKHLTASDNGKRVHMLGNLAQQCHMCGSEQTSTFNMCSTDQ